jgi:hypothetical protein
VHNQEDNFEKASRSDDVSFYGSLFSIGASGISSIRRLEEVMDAVDGLDARKRCPLLREYSRKPRDHGLLVDVPWLGEHTRSAIDPAERYRWMAERAQQWACARWGLDATPHGRSSWINTATIGKSGSALDEV